MEGVVIIGWPTTENVELFAEGGYPDLFGDEIRFRVTATPDHFLFNVMGRTMKKQHAACLVIRGITVLVQEYVAFPLVFVFVQMVDRVRGI
jgi:hypothetical protein